MAEFIDVIHTIQRICKKNGGHCSVCMLGKFACPNNARFDKTEEDAFCEFEDAVVKWDEEHPEPVYPTWMEWLTDLGAISKTISWDEPLIEAVYDAIQEHIPEETAQLLGLKPLPIINGDCGATNEADARKKLGIEPKEK